MLRLHALVITAAVVINAVLHGDLIQEISGIPDDGPIERPNGEGAPTEPGDRIGGVPISNGLQATLCLTTDDQILRWRIKFPGSDFIGIEVIVSHGAKRLGHKEFITGLGFKTLAILGLGHHTTVKNRDLITRQGILKLSDCIKTTALKLGGTTGSDQDEVAIRFRFEIDIIRTHAPVTFIGQRDIGRPVLPRPDIHPVRHIQALEIPFTGEITTVVIRGING